LSLKRSQQARHALDEQCRLFRIYESGSIPGLFQTAAYATAVIGTAIEFNGVRNDLDDAVPTRMQRQQYLYSANRRYLVVLEEQAPRTRAGTAETMCGQLDRLLVLMSSHRISLGIIPAMGERRIWVSAGFWIFDQGTVRVETPSAELTITQRGEIAVYEKRFARLQESAVYGDAARALIRGAEADFRDS